MQCLHLWSNGRSHHNVRPSDMEVKLMFPEVMLPCAVITRLLQDLGMRGVSYHTLQKRSGVLLQGIDSIPGVPQLGRLIARVFSGGQRPNTVQGKPPLTGWAKTQSLMVVSMENNERWVHNGFLQVTCARGIRAPACGVPSDESPRAPMASMSAVLEVVDHYH